MSSKPAPHAVEQGGGPERLPLPPMEALDDAQRAAAQALIDGPRKAVYGPFVPLLRVPPKRSASPSCASAARSTPGCASWSPARRPRRSATSSNG